MTKPKRTSSRPKVRAKVMEIQKRRVATWFAYYQAAARLGRYKKQMRLSWDYYWHWRNPIDAENFEVWWDHNAMLFGGISAKQEDGLEELLTVTIPLYQSETVIIEAIRSLVRSRQSELAMTKPSARKSKNQLSTAIPAGPYSFTPNTEFRCGPADDALIIYTNFVGRNGEIPPINETLLKRVQEFFDTHPTFELPRKLRETRKRELMSVLRNLRRYFERAERLLEAAATGDFPGKD